MALLFLVTLNGVADNKQVSSRLDNETWVSPQVQGLLSKKDVLAIRLEEGTKDADEAINCSAATPLPESANRQ